MVHRVRGTAATGVLVLLVALGALQSRQEPGVVAAAAVLGALSAAVLAVGSLTRWQVVAASAVSAMSIAALCAGHSGNLGWFGFCLLIWWCVVRAGTTPATWLAGGMIAALAVEWARTGDAGMANWVVGAVFTLVVTILARRQTELVDELRTAQAGLADRARAEERNRIARELHDVIGHALTVSLLHVTSARMALAADDPDDAVTSLTEAERLARRSLDEVRRAVGMMRDEAGAPATPLPGADDVADLVDQVRRAGTPVALEVVGHPDGLPDISGLTVYRVVQEALTNVARHAPGAATTVRVEYGQHATLLTVDSAGPGSNRPRQHDQAGSQVPGMRNAVPAEPGLGLVGMRERVEVIGGRLNAGPRGSGWLVEAELPR